MYIYYIWFVDTEIAAITEQKKGNIKFTYSYINERHIEDLLEYYLHVKKKMLTMNWHFILIFCVT